MQERGYVVTERPNGKLDQRLRLSTVTVTFKSMQTETFSWVLEWRISGGCLTMTHQVEDVQQVTIIPMERVSLITAVPMEVDDE